MKTSAKPLLLALVLCVAPASAAWAQTTRPVNDATELELALLDAEPGDTILLQSNITLSSSLPVVNRNLLIDGGGFMLSGAGLYPGIVVQSSEPPNLVAVAIRNLTIADTVRTAAPGVGDNAGEAAYGGGLYIGDAAWVAVDNVTIRNNRAVGGAGGDAGGDGGSAYGGGVFVSGTGNLEVFNRFELADNSVTGGAGGGSGLTGQAIGSGIYFSGYGFFSVDTAAGILATIADDLVDDEGAGLVNAGWMSLEKCGAGTLVLSGTNRYAGGTNVCGGTLQITNQNNIGTGEMRLTEGTLAITGDADVENSLYVIGPDTSLNIAAGRTVIWRGQVNDYFGEDSSLTGPLRVTGGGVLELTNVGNAYVSGTIVGGGSTVRISGDGALGHEVGSLTLGDTTGSGTLAVTAGSSVVSNRSVILAATGGIVDTGVGATTVFNGAVTGPGGLTKRGLGTLILNNAGTSYGGPTHVALGTLRTGAAGIFSATSAMTVDSGGVLDLNGFSQAVGSLSGNGSVALGSATLTVGGGDGSSTFGGSISGAGSLVKAGGGTLALTGANTYTGGTTVMGGTLAGTSASLQGNIVNNARVIFDQAFDGTFGGTMTGSGVVEKTGAGTLMLASALSHTGGTIVSGGALAGTSSTLIGHIVNNARVIFDQSTDGTFQGSISGTGVFEKTGNGTLTMTGGMASTGGIIVSGGTLAGTSSTLFGDIVNNARVVFDQNADGAYAGTMSGAGALVKSGSGVLVLTGANSYTGGTTVTGGVLAGTTTSLQGNIINNAAVVFDQAFDGTFAGAMSGSGMVQKAGSGTLTITGGLSHTGGTFVTGGRLVGDASMLSGIVLNDASITFGDSSDHTFDGMLAGGGTFDKTGSGVLRLTGAHSHNGLFNVTSGVLDLDGTIASRFTVGPGATLRALGTIFGSATIDGLLSIPSPAPSAGATTSRLAADGPFDASPLLMIGGDLNMTPGARLSMPVMFGSTPSIYVGGTASFNGATIDVTPTEPLTERSTSFLALAAANGLQFLNTTGTTSNPMYLPVLRPDRNSLVVTILNMGIPLSSDVTDPNAASVGRVIDNFKNNPTPDQQTVIRELTGLNDDELDRALRQISGEAHASFLQIGIRDSEATNDLIRRHVSTRRRDVRPGANLNMSWWGQMGGERTRLSNADGERVGVIDLGSGTGGMDYHASDRWTFGLGAGLAAGTINITDLVSKGDIMSPRGFGYAGWQPENFGRFTGGATFARQKMDSKRQLRFQGRLPDELGGDPIGDGIDREAEAEEVTLVKDQWTDWDDEHEIRTYSLSYVLGYRRATFTRRGFIESGADSLSLEMPEQTLRLRQVNTLLNVWRREGDFRPFGEFLYRREITDGTTTTLLEFPDAGDSRFTVDGLPAPQNIVRLQLGAVWHARSRTWKFEYHYRNATGQSTHGGSLHVTF